MRLFDSRSSSQAAAAILILTLPFGASGQPEAAAPSWNLEIPTAVTEVLMHQRTIREPIAKVTDRNNRPVAGAAVTFLIIPNGGAGATFPGGQLTLTVQTDAQGVARGAVMQNNGVTGTYQVRVSASYQDRVQTKEIRYKVKKHSTKYKYSLTAAAILLLVGTVVAVTTRGGQSNPEITAGQGTVGR